MKSILLLALSALPLVACAGTVDDRESPDDTATSQDAFTFTITYDIDFDKDPQGNPIPDGTIVDNVYAAWGVTFSGITCSTGGCTTGHAYARSNGSTNTVSPIAPSAGLPLFNAKTGAVRADFVNPRPWVSIDATPVLLPECAGTVAAEPWFEGYNANTPAQLVQPTVYYPLLPSGAECVNNGVTGPATGWGNQETLKVNTGTNTIKWVRFSSQVVNGTPSVYGEFDNLRFPSDPIVFNPPCIRKLGGGC